MWGKFFSLFDTFESEHKLIVSPATFKKKLLTFLCHDVTVELKEGGCGTCHVTLAMMLYLVGPDRAMSLQKLLYLSQRLEMFVISTYPSGTSSEDQEVLLLKLAHNFFPEINILHYSREVSQLLPSSLVYLVLWIFSCKRSI